MATFDRERNAQVRRPATAIGQPSAADGSRTLSALTPRQREVLLLMGEGKTCAEISRALHLARSTVTLHKRSIMRRLGIAEQAALVRADSSGFLSPTLNRCAVSADGRLLFVSSGTGPVGPTFGPQPGRLFVVDRATGALVRTVDIGDWLTREVFAF